MWVRVRVGVRVRVRVLQHELSQYRQHRCRPASCTGLEESSERLRGARVRVMVNERVTVRVRVRVRVRSRVRVRVRSRFGLVIRVRKGSEWLVQLWLTVSHQP